MASRLRTPLALRPCQFALWAAGFLVPLDQREAWRAEWLSELWYRWLELVASRQWSSRSAVAFYRCCLGCFRDAAAQWHTQRTHRLLWQTVSQRGAHAVITIATLLVLLTITDQLRAVRAVVQPSPFPNASEVAVASRSGRVQTSRHGLPASLAEAWFQDSQLVRDLAPCFLNRSSMLLMKGHQDVLTSIESTPNLFDLLGIPLPSQARQILASGTHVAFVSNRYWEHALHGNTSLIGKRIRLNHHSAVLAGVLPRNFWLLSPSEQIYDLGPRSVREQDSLLIRTTSGISTTALEADLRHIAAAHGTPFLHTSPRVLFLTDSVHAPLQMFFLSLLIAATLNALARSNRTLHWRRQTLSWWAFLLTKTVAGLILVFVMAVELVIAVPHQAANQALGGPVLLWFSTLGCFLVLHFSLNDQQSRCRICLEHLAHPIRIGCPGCLLLDWSGTELLCPDGHGSLYVPHHIACWGQAPEWVTHEL